ncbi:MAG: T9SS C-terminal target domain-containing protein, partial [Calditrichaeota bacterium]
IDLSQIDTSRFENMFIKKDIIPISGDSGYPIRLGDFNNNGQLDFYGDYKWVQDYKLVNAAIVELTADSMFIVQKIFKDSLTGPLPVTDLDKNGIPEINFRQNRKLAHLKSTTQDSFPDSVDFLFRLWKSGGGAVSGETFYDFDKDGNMDLVYVADDTLEPRDQLKVFVAEYNPQINNFEDKFRFKPDDYYFDGFSVGDFDEDGFPEFALGSIHGDVYVFENSGNDSYGLVFQDTISTSNAYLSVATNDIDNNGKKEFFIGGSSYFNGVGGTRYYWFEADGDNHYKKVRSLLLLGIDPLGVDEIHVFDMNNDGKDDILINYTWSLIVLTWNNDTQAFEVLYFLPSDYEIYGATMYDLNNDHKLDMFMSTKEDDHLPALRTYYMQANYTVTGMSKIKRTQPLNFKLGQNYPNPFNPVTTIPFRINQTENISIKIYNTAGQLIKTSVKNQKYSPGRYQIKWNGLTSSGKEVGSGVYIVTLQAGQQFLSRKMLLIK